MNRPQLTLRTRLGLWSVVTLTWAAVGLGCGFVAGQFSATELNEYHLQKFKERDETRARCIAGNDRACRVYEADSDA